MRAATGRFKERFIHGESCKSKGSSSIFVVFRLLLETLRDFLVLKIGQFWNFQLNASSDDARMQYHSLRLSLDVFVVLR